MTHRFKPFDKVIARHSNDDIWACELFSHYQEKNAYPYICIGSRYKECVPYNEETAHLVGTTKDYKPEEPKEWEVRSSNGLFVEKYTSSELQNFINTAVINNKDITNFSITRIF